MLSWRNTENFFDASQDRLVVSAMTGVVAVPAEHDTAMFRRVR